MKVSYTGIPHELPDKAQRKVDAKFGKLSKLLEARGEHSAHVIVRQQRKSFQAEVTVSFYDHQFIGIGSDTDLLTALSAAIEKLESQALKQRAKWREKKRRAELPPAEPPAPPEPPKPARKAAQEKAAAKNANRVVRVRTPEQQKPITLDEALIEIGKDRDYLVYHDASRRAVSVLIRRADGSFDLIEA